jgi:hypothetical protein
VFFSIWLPGLLFSFCCGISSSTAYRALSSASTVMTVASVLMAVRFLAVQKEDGKAGKRQLLIMMLIFAITAGVQISLEFIDRYNDIYDGDRIQNQQIRAEEGPEKGIWMNPDVYEFYATTQDDIKSVNLGAVYESVVAQELRSHGYKLFYYDNRNKGEVDFIIDDYNSTSVLPIEVKSGRDYSIHSALNNLISTNEYNVKSAFVLSNEREVKQKDKILYLPVYYIMFINNMESETNYIF